MEDLIYIINETIGWKKVDLSDYQEGLKLDRFERTEFYKPSFKLTYMIDNGKEPVLDYNLFYMGEYADLRPFVNSPKFFDILEFVLNRSWYGSKINFIFCVYEALRHKNYKVMEDLYLNYVVKKEFIDTFILRSWNKEGIEIVKNIPSIKIDMIYVVRDYWYLYDFIFAYYKIRPEEFNVRLMHYILQTYYRTHKIEISRKLKISFRKLINPVEDCCPVCYDKKCDCSKVIPGKLDQCPYPCNKPDHKYCHSCNQCIYGKHEHCPVCLDYFDKYDNCMC